MKSDIQISVIMACYNSAGYLDEAIESVLSQSFKDLELILIDDLSNDNTLSICEDYKKQDERVKVISLSVNSGAAFARNAGIAIAKGEWIGILDSDDVALPTRFEEQMILAQSHGKLQLIGSNASLIDRSGRLLQKYKYPTGHKALLRRLSSMTAFPPHSSMLYRKDAVQRVSGFNQKFIRSQDWDLWLRISELGQLASIDKNLVKIRKHESNISDSDHGMLQEKYGLIAAICHILRDRGYPDPSTSDDEILWQKFILWVDAKMIEDGIFERKKSWKQSVKTYYSNRNRVIGSFRFIIDVLRSGFAIQLITDRIYGRGVPYRLFNKLIKEGCGLTHNQTT